MHSNPLRYGLVLLLASACTQPAIQDVSNKGSMFFGRNATYQGGTEVPMYSDAHRATQSPEIEDKYKSDVHQYGVGAPSGEVGVQDLPPPSASPASSVVAPQSSSQQVEAKPLAQSVVANPISEVEAAPEIIAAAPVTPVAAPVIQEAAATPDSRFAWPVQGKVITGYGDAGKGVVRQGINIAAVEGTPIRAAADGTVAYAGNGLRGYGNLIMVRHEGGWSSAYAHASKIEKPKGSTVRQGDVIGYVGHTGNVKSSQLHFAIRKDDKPVNPQDYLSKQVATR